MTTELTFRIGVPAEIGTLLPQLSLAADTRGTVTVAETDDWLELTIDYAKGGQDVVRLEAVDGRTLIERIMGQVGTRLVFDRQ